MYMCYLSPREKGNMCLTKLLGRLTHLHVTVRWLPQFGGRVGGWVGMQGECFGVGRGMGLCLWLKIPWFWRPLFQFSLQLLNSNIAIPFSLFGSCLILYDFLKFLSHGNWCASWAAMAVVVLFIALCLFCSFSYRTLCLVITSFAQISWCFFLCLLDRHPLLWDSELQLFAWTSCRHVSIVGWGRDWWLSLYVFPHQSQVQGNKNWGKWLPQQIPPLEFSCVYVW